MIDKEIVVAVAPSRAFLAWTRRIGMWWPPGHRMSGSTDGDLAFEERVGGRLFERTPDGREFDYGVVLEWDPPACLRHSFFPGTGRDQPTEVEVRFVAVEGGTRVEVRHRAAGSAAFPKTAAVFERNWEVVLAAFAEHARIATP